MRVNALELPVYPVLRGYGRIPVQLEEPFKTERSEASPICAGRPRAAFAPGPFPLRPGPGSRFKELPSSADSPAHDRTPSRIKGARQGVASDHSVVPSMAESGSNAVVVNEVEEHQVMTCARSTARPEETTYGLKAIRALSDMY